MSIVNPGFDPENIQKLREEFANLGTSYKIIPDEENSEEFVNFYFLGMYEGREVIYDAALYTLRLHHSSEVYELAEHEAAKKFPNFNGISYEEDENGNMLPLTSEQEEVGWFITEIIMDIEEAESVKVQEFVDIDTHHDFGIGLDAALNVDQVDDPMIKKFITEFNDDTLILDETAYTFQSEEEDFE